MVSKYTLKLFRITEGVFFKKKKKNTICAFCYLSYTVVLAWKEFNWKSYVIYWKKLV